MIEGHFMYTYMAILEVHTNRTQQDDTLGTYIHRHEYFARLRAFLRRHAPHCTCYRSTRLLSEAYLQEFTCYLRDTQNVFCATSYRSNQTIYVNNRLKNRPFIFVSSLSSGTSTFPSAIVDWPFLSRSPSSPLLPLSIPQTAF